jgi:arylsulfatase A-like enzyme
MKTFLNQFNQVQKSVFPASMILFTLSGYSQNAIQKPNIVILFADDQRFQGTIHALGGREVITPNLDKLVNEGVSFTHSYIMGGCQPAVSVPSRNMLMTGRNLFSLGSSNGILIGEKHVTIGEAFSNNGYSTFCIGKWHNDQLAINRTFNSGDEIFFGGMGDQFNMPLSHYDNEGRYATKLPLPWDSTKKMIADHIYPNKHSSEIFSERAVRFIKEYDSKKPFLLYVAFTAPHDPRIIPEKYKAMYDTSKIKLPVNFMAKHPFDNGELEIRDELLAGFPRSPQEIKCHIRDYYAIITHLDEQIGNIINSLKEKGIYENTIIVFAGDNGLALGQHGLMGKQSVYEHSVKVPLIIVGKGLPKGQVNSDFAYLFDVFPTICRLTDTPIPSTVQGVPLFGKQVKPREIMYYAYRDFQRAVRKGDWKMIKYQVKGNHTTQLFNLKKDLWEMNNISDDPAYAEKLNELNQELEKQRILNGDTLKMSN